MPKRPNFGTPIGQADWQAAGAQSELHDVGNVGHCIEGDNHRQRASLPGIATNFLSAHLSRMFHEARM